MHKPSPRWLVLTALLLMALPSAPSAQQNTNPVQSSKPENPAFKLSTRTNVVIVPVAVADKHGDHVSGLTVNDFEVKEDGKEQKIASFEEITSDQKAVVAAALPAGRFSNQINADHARKLEIIAIDQINTRFDAGLQPKLADFLVKHVDANTLIALVAFEPNGVIIIHSFASDPAILVAAMHKLHTRIGASDSGSLDNAGLNTIGDTSAIDTEAAEIQAMLSGTLEQATQAPPGFARVQAFRAATRNAQSSVDASRAAQNSLITLECLQQVAQYFAGVPGWKSLIWATTGFSYNRGAISGTATRGSTPDDWEKTMHALQNANIAVYPVDVGGLLTGGPPSNLSNLTAAQQSGGMDVSARSGALQSVESGSLLDPLEATHATMDAMAAMSGGEAFYNANNAADLFHRAEGDSSQYYLLSYATGNTNKYGWRKLSVKVRKDGVKVRSRNGYYFSDPTREAEVIRQAEETMAVNSDLNFTALPIVGQWQQTENKGKERLVHFALLIPPGAASIDSEHENHMSLDFRIKAMGADGKPAADVAQRLDRKLSAEDAKEVQEQGVGYQNALTLPPGDYKVHFAVRDNLRGVLGNVVTSLKVD